MWAEEVELVGVAGEDSWKNELRVCDLSGVQISVVCVLFGIKHLFSFWLLKIAFP